MTSERVDSVGEEVDVIDDGSDGWWEVKGGEGDGA